MSISLTETARNHVRSFLEKEQGCGLRVGVKRTGCSGWAYTVEIALQPNDDDVEFLDDGVTVLVPRDALAIIDGTEVDFVTQGLNRVFVFRNPNVTDECGCGESFAVG
ncbi:MAG: iron-sulfur cluster assembly accessory protein [Xanthomonadales bacterium]|nr:iron-sulfur cluster assembly accessory protein [Xanthomonadales bacterium]